jgi:serine-type D-Ala-D-Ala carboxypeptidase (penicillin-binding protein 5/6)
VRLALRVTGRAASRARARERGSAPRRGARDAIARAAALAAASLAAATLAPAAATAAAGHAGATPPDLHVSGASLIVERSGQQLYGVDANSELAIASTTKIMTALVTLQHVKHLDTVFTQNDWYPAAADSQLGLLPGDRMTVHDLLEAMLLPSADDAAEDLAYNVGGGSVARFVGMMNAEARKLGLDHTHYSTPIGLDTPGNYSSPLDLVHLAAYVLRTQPFFRRAVDRPTVALATGPVRTVVNRNDLVARFPWINGVKTGHTADAGYVLVASGRRHGMTLVGAVLGTPSEAARDQNALALLEYGFDAFRTVRPVQAGEVLARPTVRDATGTRATVVAGGSFTRIVKRTDRVQTRVRVPSRLAGPLPRHAIVGQVAVLIDGRTVDRIPLLLTRALPAISPLTLAGRFLTGAPALLSLGALVAIALAVTARRRGLLRVPARNRLEAR